MIYVHVIDVGSERSVERFYRQVADVERLDDRGVRDATRDWRAEHRAERRSAA